MRLFTPRRLALAALVPALLALSVIPGCSNESEGERCGDDTGVTDNDDCGSGLVCTAFPLNDGTTNTVGRCCYTDHVTDSRCLMGNGVNATSGGSSGIAGSSGKAGSSGTAGSAAGGASGSGVGQAGAATETAGAAGSN